MPASSSRPETRKDWLFWDGECGVCCWWVAWVRRRRADERFRIIPYQKAPSPPMTEGLRERSARAVQVVTSDGLNLEAGRACLYVLEALGWKSIARFLAVPPMIWIVELEYQVVARNRRFFSRFLSRDPDSC